jgi:hypothetical protein
MASAGIEIVGSTPAEFGAFFRSERELWAKVIRETGANIDYRSLRRTRAQ